MEKLFEQLKEYLHMDTEIPFEEFNKYYKELIEFLNTQYNDLDQANLIKARYICSIVQANAEARAKQSKTNAKAFRKIESKCSFWADAINYRLRKEGMTQEEIDNATQQINEEI